MKYRIQKNHDRYRVQYRHWWWPLWTTEKVRVFDRRQGHYVLRPWTSYTIAGAQTKIKELRRRHGSWETIATDD